MRFFAAATKSSNLSQTFLCPVNSLNIGGRSDTSKAASGSGGFMVDLAGNLIASNERLRTTRFWGTLKRWDNVCAVIQGSARVSHVGFGVSPKQSSGKVRDLEDAMANTRNALATPNSPSRAAHEIFFVNTSSVPRCRKI